jgi:2-polyprenyl-3-methyl-5-hydroxy-6-metoxy-1,4-benzoquinol methylase
MSDLPFTGERFTPECVREMLYEHYARYAMAQRFVHGKKVLDAACGEGYGSALLAASAQQVLGVDISAEAVAHAQARYPLANLQFAQGDATVPQAEADFDVIVSFETLEHVHAQASMLANFKRALKPDGVLLISSPDKRTYSDLTGFSNQFHVKELYRHELEALLQSQFRHVHLFGQKLLFQSAIWDLSAPPSVLETATQTELGTQSGLHYAPLYFIAVCSDDAAAAQQAAGKLFLFGDQAESIYAHYNAEIRNGIEAGLLLKRLREAGQI